MAALNRRQARFVEAYLQTWNASEAARQSGYKGKRPDQAGHQMLRNSEVAAAVDARMGEIQMGSSEALTRLAQQARSNIATFYHQDGSLNWSEIENQGHLVKRIKARTTRRTTPNGGETETTETDLELHDGQAALIKIGEHHRLFGSRSAIEEAAANGALQSNVTVYLPDNGRPRRNDDPTTH